MNKTIVKELDEKLTEIELLQEQVEKILYSKNPFYKWLNFKKGIKLHNLASKKMQYVNSGQFLIDRGIAC